MTPPTTTTLLPVLVPRAGRVVARPYVFLALLQVLDVATTGWILHYWTVRAEGNPIAAHLFDGLGLGVGLAVLLAMKLSLVWLFWACQTRVRIVAAIYSAVIINNLCFLVLWLLA